LGLYNNIKPKFVKRYVDSYSLFLDSIRNYIREIKSGAFPDFVHSFSMPAEELNKFEHYLNDSKINMK
jgi:3-methyl-2-oxobutanoate hydroxymethyltransferase